MIKTRIGTLPPKCTKIIGGWALAGLRGLLLLLRKREKERRGRETLDPHNVGNRLTPLTMRILFFNEETACQSM